MNAMHVNLHFLDYVWATVRTYCLFKVRVTFFTVLQSSGAGRDAEEWGETER